MEDVDAWGEEPDWDTEYAANSLDPEDEGFFGAQHILVLIDSAREMYVPSISCQDTMLSPMDAAMNACQCMLRHKLNQVAVRKIGKRDGIGIVLYGPKLVSHDDSSSDEGDVDSDLEAEESPPIPSTNSLLKSILSLSPPGIQQVKTLQHIVEERDLREEYCPDADTDSSRPLRSALSEASKVFNNAKCVKKRTLSDKAPPDFKSIWIFTCRDTPCRDLLHERQYLLEAAKDVKENGISIQVWPLCIHFDTSIFYNDIVSTPPADEFDYVDMLDSMQLQWNKTRRVLSVPLLLPATPPEHPGIMLDFFRTVNPQRRPMPVWITQTTKKMTEKITHTIAQDTGDILRTTGRGEGVKPVAMDRIFTYTEFGGERIPLTPTDVASIKAGSNAHKDASLALVGFKPLSDIPITFLLEKSYFCYPNDDAVKGSTDAFANLHASMRRKHVVLIGELLSRATTSSRLVALIPQAERNNSEGDTVLAPGMVVVTLPFEDDVREMEMDAGDTSTPALVEQAKGLLRALKLSDVQFWTDFENMCLKRFWTYIEEAALGVISPHKDFLCGTEIGDDRLREILGEHISGFISELPCDENEEKETGTTRKRKVTAEDESGCDWVQLYTTDSLSECKVDELKHYLRSMGARVSGKKDDLVLRVSQSIGERMSKGEL